MRLFGQHKGKVLPGAKSPFLGRFLAVLSTFDRRLYVTGWHGAASAPCILSASSSVIVTDSVTVTVTGCLNCSYNRFKTVS